jgi:hypothetical protein
VVYSGIVTLLTLLAAPRSAARVHASQTRHRTDEHHQIGPTLRSRRRPAPGVGPGVWGLYTMILPCRELSRL